MRAQALRVPMLEAELEMNNNVAAFGHGYDCLGGIAHRQGRKEPIRRQRSSPTDSSDDLMYRGYICDSCYHELKPAAGYMFFSSGNFSKTSLWRRKNDVGKGPVLNPEKKSVTRPRLGTGPLLCKPRIPTLCPCAHLFNSYYL